MIGIPRGAWEHMKDGKTNHFDLTAVGFPVKFLLYGAATPEDCVQVIKDFNEREGRETEGDPRRDLGIKFPTEH